MSDHLAGRKADHLRIALDGDVGFERVRTGFDEVRVRARALPGRDLSDVDLGVVRFGRRLAAPLLVSCMTGGTTEAGSVNRALASAAQTHGVALGLGSGRIALEDTASRASFEVRDLAADVPVLANLGVTQLRSHGLEGCRRLVELCAADGLVLHLNAVQEAVQDGGDTAFAGALEGITAVCRALDVPVVVKEVGFGMAPEDVLALARAGVAGIDVAGAGGTNWAKVEGARSTSAGELAAAFADWGWPTARCLRDARAMLDRHGFASVTLIASGGLRHGVDALKALCLGADLAGIARGLLGAGAAGPEAATKAVGAIVQQLRIGAWAAGAARAADLDASRVEPVHPWEGGGAR